MNNALKKMPNFLKILPFFQSLYWKTETDHKAATTKETKTVTSGGVVVELLAEILSIQMFVDVVNLISTEFWHDQWKHMIYLKADEMTFTLNVTQEIFSLK